MKHNPLNGWAYVFVIATACSSEYTDPECNGDRSMLKPLVTGVDVALFDEAGRPVCRPATVVAGQPGRTTFTVPRSIIAYATLLPNGRFAAFVGPPCNFYEGTPVGGPTALGLLRCGPPLDWSVTVPGCDPARGSYSWNDNTFPGRTFPSFALTVRLQCHGTNDGSVPTDAASAADVTED
jgi:hypothetical protein